MGVILCQEGATKTRNIVKNYVLRRSKHTYEEKEPKKRYVKDSG